MVATLIFDGDCGFCTTSANWVERRTTADVVPWQRFDLDAAGLTEAEASAAVQWVDGEQRLSGARAIAAVLRRCGGAWPLVGRLIDLPPMRPLAALGYRLVARYRYRLPGGTPACRIG